MASSTAFEAQYLAPSGSNAIRAAAGRHQVAGAVYSLRRQMQDGNSAATAHAVTDVPRVLEAVDRATREMGDPTVKSAYTGIDSA